MPTYTFNCSCGWRDDRRVRFGTFTVPCPSCGRSTDKEQVYSIGFGGFASTPLDQRTYWQEFKDYQEAGAELEYKHSRAEEAAGKKLPTPPISRMAKAKARKLMAAGVQSSEDWKDREKH